MTKNNAFRIRPRFQATSRLTPEAIDKLFKEHIYAQDAAFDGKVTHGFLSIYPLPADHHYWSPHLSVIVEEDPEGSLLRGHYGPSPAVWTMFVFLYAIVGLSAVIFTVIGFANRTIGLSSSVLWVVPLLVLIFLSLYYVSYLGQKKGSDQIQAIHQFLEKILDEKIN